ncbi:MAG TPA: VCBS repeat-containing protein [Pirellulales bacterium]|nr:VCBS repeat-containing protein [Pirellulales bacterium]
MFHRIVLTLAVVVVPSMVSAGTITFKKTTVDPKFRSEGVTVGDFNHDGKPDIAAGQVYFSAPDWQMHVIRPDATEYDPLKYSLSFNNFADDLNGDGWTDVIVVEYPGKDTAWYENPRGSDRMWERHVCVPVSNNESPQYRDVDGNGRRALVMGYSPDPKKFDGPEKQMIIARPADDPTALWNLQTISELNVDAAKRFQHGLGVGDINGDGRRDVLTTLGWWEAPSEKLASPWTFHAADLGPNCADMYVFDIDADGDNDVLSSAGHEIGIWWHEQTADGWTRHEIDHSFSQTHALCLADINGDGLPDFVTGKRWWAHGPNKDVNPGDPAVMYWFEFSREGGKPAWTPHKFDDDSGVGTQFEVADVNGDGLLDVVTSNKKGTFYFEQVRSN